MPHITTHCSTLLNRKTGLGLFRTIEGALFWVIDHSFCKVAVQLNTTSDSLAYSYYRLGDEPLAEGDHLGEARLSIGYRADDDFIGRVGILIRYKRDTYLKVRGNHQPTERLRLVEICRQQRHMTPCYQGTAYFPYWNLSLAAGSLKEPVFASAIDPDWTKVGT